jgi:hypothetical protein
MPTIFTAANAMIAAMGISGARNSGFMAFLLL